MRVLVVTPWPVFPLTHGGSVRIHRLARALAIAGGSVEVLGPWYPGQPRASFERDGVVWHSHLLPGNILPKLLPERIAPGTLAFSLRPVRIGPRRVLRRLGPFDVLQLETPTVIRWARVAPGSPRVVYASHNVELEYVIERSVAPLRGPMSRIMRTLEAEAVRKSDLITACTEADLTRLSELFGAGNPGIVLPTPYDDSLASAPLESLRPGARERLGIGPDQRCLLFLAGRAKHNRDALALLEGTVMPRLRGNNTLLVVGRCPSSGADPGPRSRVRRLGFVDDLRPVLAAADVALNPVTAGSGASVKLVDYLAAGLDVVSTPIGLRGYDALADHVRVAEIEDFPEAIAESVSEGRRDLAAALAPLAPEAVGRRLLAAYEANRV